uniref:Uncharacterized protein n=1 Tax=Amphimedon queenslandica TaxID=400682 RepID=A0A1X7U9J9_AMPQE
MVSGLNFNAFKSFHMSFRNDGASAYEYFLNRSRKAYAKLSLVRRTFSVHSPTYVKKMLYLTLVRSQLTYLSQVWRPMLIEDIESLEREQCHATKYMLNDWESDYRSRLVALHLIPLHYFLELQDIIFLYCVSNIQTLVLIFMSLYHFHPAVLALLLNPQFADLVIYISIESLDYGTFS